MSGLCLLSSALSCVCLTGWEAIPMRILQLLFARWVCFQVCTGSCSFCERCGTERGQKTGTSFITVILLWVGFTERILTLRESGSAAIMDDLKWVGGGRALTPVTVSFSQVAKAPLLVYISATTQFTTKMLQVPGLSFTRSIMCFFSLNVILSCNGGVVRTGQGMKSTDEQSIFIVLLTAESQFTPTFMKQKKLSTILLGFDDFIKTGSELSSFINTSWRQVKWGSYLTYIV